MPGDSNSKPSFSRARRWGIGFDVVFRTALVLAVLIMLNYLSSHYFKLAFLSSQTRITLAPRTLSVLESLTNQVQVTLYFDKEDPLYTTVSSLLNEYQRKNSRIHVNAVDWYRDYGRAVDVLSKYRGFNLVASTNKNMVIFDCNGRVDVVNKEALAHYTLEVANPTEREFQKRMTAFLGEMQFTASLLNVTRPKPYQAYFLQGDGENSPDADDEMGYRKFADILRQNAVQTNSLSLIGTNQVPADCDLLILAGPRTAIPEPAIQKISQYLIEGHRMLALVNPLANNGPTGLEQILAGWGVDVGRATVSDPENSISVYSNDVVVGDPIYGTPLSAIRHPIVGPLTGMELHMILPRPVGPLEVSNPRADAPRVTPIAFSGPHAVLIEDGQARRQGRFPLAVAVENTVKGVVTERGSTRIVAVGDSIFLGNYQIASAANRDFAAYAVNWLLDRPELLKGLEPRPVTEFRLETTQAQLRDAQWLLLVAMPGAVLLLGGLVWLRRRK